MEEAHTNGTPDAGHGDLTYQNRPARQGGSLAAELRLLVALLAVGLCLRYAFVARDFVITNDSVGYLHAAMAMEKGDVAAFSANMRQPLYPAALWLGGRVAQALEPSFQWSGGQMAEVGRWTSLALYLPFMFVAWLFCRRVAGSAVAPWCLFAIIIHPLFGYYFANVLSETLYLTFLAAALLFMMNAAESATSGRATALAWGLCAGMAAALAFLTRAEGLILVVAGLTWFAYGCIARLRAHESRDARASILAALGLLAGVALPALPVALYLKATSSRYSLAWLWDRISAVGGLTSGPGLAAHPLDAAGMLVATFVAHAPELAAIGIAAVLLWFHRRAASPQAPLLPAAYAIVVVAAAWYALAIVVGVTIQNGVVSQRYIQPLVLAAIPAAAAFVVSLTGTGHGVRRTARVLAVLALIAASIGACVKWSDSKMGFRAVGIAIAGASDPGVRVLTSNPRVAFYADVPDARLRGADIISAVTGGAVRDYDCVVIETRYLGGETIEKCAAALESQGFGGVPWLDVPEDGRKDRRGNRLVVFSRTAPRQGPPA